MLGATPHAEIGAAVALWLQGCWYAPVHDLQGNVATLLPLDGGKPTQYSFGAFGEEQIDGKAPNPWRFSSKRTDADTGFVNYGRRYYLLKYGRWLSSDPLGFTAGVNLYTFLSNDPLTTLDEYGLHDVGSLAMLHRWKGDGYAVSSRDQNLMKGYAGAAHGAVQFGVNILHEWQAIATEIGVQQLELGRHGRDAAIGAVERMQSSQSLALDSYLRNQFSVSRTDVSYNRGYAAGMYGAEIGSSIAGAYGIAKGLWQVGRAAYGAYRGGSLFSPTRKLFNFTNTAGKHMFEVERRIPVHILDEVVKSPMAVVKDPRGASNAMMHYSQVWKNGKLYNVEVLYDKTANTISHFQYTQKPIGPLKKVSK